MNTNSVKGDTIEMRLRYLGATDIQKVQGTLYFVEFKQDTHSVSYAYNVNAKNKYFLQRIKPYPIPEGIFSDEQQVVEFIKKDLNKFRNAKLSRNFEDFIELTNTLTAAAQDMERFFLNYNVDKECLDYLLKDLNGIRSTIEQAKKRSEHIII